MLRGFGDLLSDLSRNDGLRWFVRVRATGRLTRMLRRQSQRFSRGLSGLRGLTTISLFGLVLRLLHLCLSLRGFLAGLLR